MVVMDTFVAAAVGSGSCVVEYAGKFPAEEGLGAERKTGEGQFMMNKYMMDNLNFYNRAVVFSGG